MPPEALSVPSRVRTAAVYLALLLALLVVGSVYYALTAGIEPGLVLSFAAEAAGTAFVLLAPSARHLTTLRILIAAFVLLWLASWLATLVVWGGLEPLELLGVAIVLAAVHAMLQIAGPSRTASASEPAAAAALAAGSPREQAPPAPGLEPSPPAAEDRRHIFISYAREDQDFAERLVAALEGGARAAWIDRTEIRAGAEWWAKVQQGIEGALAVVLVLSPDFVASRVCRDEVEHAVSLNKRLVPVMHRKVASDATHERVRALNWILGGDDFAATFAAVVETAETDQDWLDRHARLNERSGDWHRSGRDRSLLLRGSDLKDAEHWLGEQGSHRESATPLQQEFIVASRSRETARLRTVVVGVLIALAVSVALGAYAWYERGNAIERAKIAQSRALAVSSAAQVAVDPELALILALEAHETAPTKQALSAIRRAVPATHVRATVEPEGTVETLQFRRGGRELVTSGGDVQAWDTDTGRALPDPGIPAPRWQATVFDELDCPNGLATGSRASPVGDVEAVVCSGGRVLVQDASTGETRFSIGSGGFSPAIEVHMSFDRAGRRLAVAVGEAPIAEVWDIGERRRISLLRGHSAPIRSLALSGDGRWAITGSFDTTARVWDVETGRTSLTLRGHTRRITAVTISEDGSLAATASLGGEARVWNTAPVRIVEQAPIDSGRADAWTEATLPYTVRAGDRGGEVVERRTGKLVSTLAWGDVAPDAVEFSADGRRLVTVGGGPSPAVWDAARGVRIATIDEATPIYASALTPAGERLVTGGQSGVIRLWDISRPAVPDIVDEARGPILDIATSPDGRRFAVASGHPVARVYEVERWWAAPVLLIGHEAQVTAVEFSPDSGLVLTTGADDTARVWEAATGELLVSLPAPNAADGTRARFTRDGTRVVVLDAGADVARLLECDVCGTVAQLVQRARSRITRALTDQERASFLVDESG